MMRNASVYLVDLTKIDGEGDFPCPKCGVNISPEDEEEKVYTIEEVKMKRDHLEELILRCNNCRSIIRLIGFNNTS